MESAYYIIAHHLPAYTWPLLVFLFLALLSVCLRCVKRGSRKRERREVVTRAILLSFFFTYIIAILFSTLLIRTPAAEPKAAWIPLWSWYEVIANHRKSLFYEIVLNILLFVPVGVLIRLLWGICWRHAFLVGLVFSCFIEWMQLITCRGLFEWDDMLHNGLGCMIGAWAAGLAHAAQRKHGRKNGREGGDGENRAKAAEDN